jgi:D-alanyl-D-alanine carboxypeptidase/D-alanyl-D-alanine-endopeptidase (penicillin-binding protein 4)
LNENVVQATLAPGAAPGSSAQVTLAPDLHVLAVDNKVVTSAAGIQATVSARRPAGGTTLALSGTLPVDSAPLSRLVSVANPTLFFASALRAALISRGIEVDGPSVDIDDLPGARSERRTVLAVHHSAPLSQVAVRLMKDSQNLYADTLLKTVAAAAGPPTFEGGRVAIAESLAAWGIPPADVVQVDGSGLSRYNYVTAGALMAILTHVDRDERLRAPFEASLSVAGRDGTLATRMKGTPAEGNVRAKSGTLANVRTLTGYVASADGEPLMFVILANNFGTMPEVAVAAIDAIVVRLAQFTRS